jgi:hypothetical protein
MLIFLHVIIILAFSIFAGYGIISLFSHLFEIDKNKKLFLITPIFGYALSQILFYQLYLVYENARISFAFAILIIVIINAICFIIISWNQKIGKTLKSFQPEKHDYKLLWILLAVFILSAWQYMLVGEGFYYHSGNEDFFDGVRGGGVYLANTPMKYIRYDMFENINFVAVIDLQYSSQAFWRLLLNVGGVDGFLLQAILNLFLTCIGVYWLVVYVFNGNKNVALWISFWSVAISFYFVTYMTGHIGSMMYVSVITIPLGLFLLWSRKEIKWVWLILIYVFLYFIHNTYPGPIYFLIIPAVLLAIHERVLTPLNLWKIFSDFFGISLINSKKLQFNKQKLLRQIILMIFILLGALFIIQFSWNYFEINRIQAILRQNVSWKITLFKEMFMVFWGIYPPGSTGTTSILPLFLSNDVINYSALFLALVISSIAFYTVFHCRLIKERRFLFIYGILFIWFLIVIRYFWGSSYYFYKFLYVHLFLIVIVLILWIYERRKYWSKPKRTIILAVFYFLGFLNIIWDISLGLDFYQRPYNDKKSITDFFEKVPDNLLKEAYLDIPNEVNNLTFRHLFKDRGIEVIYSKELKATAHYFIQVKNIQNATNNLVTHQNVIYENKVLRISEAVKENDMTVFTLYDPDFVADININWVGNKMTIEGYYLKDDTDQLIDFIKTQGQNKNIYIDIFETEAYNLIYRQLLINNIKVNPNPVESNWFIRMRGDGVVYSPTKGDSLVWNGLVLAIENLPESGRIIRPLSHFKDISDPHRLNFTDIYYMIKNRGSSVYLDMPHHEHAYLFLTEMLTKNGIKIVDNPDESRLVLRFRLFPPYEEFNYMTVTHPNEELLANARYQSYFFNYKWTVELVDIPLEGRTMSEENIEILPIPYRILSASYSEDYILKIQNITDNAKYIRLFIEPGPGIDFKNFILKVGNGKDISNNYLITNPQTLLNIPLKDYGVADSSVFELKLESVDLIGHSLLPLEERYLNYVIVGAELTDNIDTYSDYALKVINHEPLSIVSILLDRIFGIKGLKREEIDIIDRTNTNNIIFGMGWYPIESLNHETYRWVGDNTAEIVLKNIDKKNNVVHVAIEPGPSCGGKPLKLKVYNKDQLIKDEVVNGRSNFEIQLPEEIYENNKEQIILKLVAETVNTKIASDSRILNYRVFNISLKEAAPQQKTIIDKAYHNKINLGGGWFPFEEYKEESFQWVGKEPAEIVLNNIDDKQNIVQLNLEPGPGCGGKQLDLKIYGNNKLIKEEIIQGRKNIEIELPEELYENNKKVVLKLIAKTENTKIASDPRILNLRVFNISLKKATPPEKTIIDEPSLDNLSLGNGWYPYEIYEGESFQWVGKKQAEIIFRNSDNDFKKIALNLEPGPSCGVDPLKLSVFINEKLIDRYNLLDKKTIEIDLIKNKNYIKNGKNIIRLVPSTKNVIVPGDTRILNFRVFNISYLY